MAYIMELKDGQKIEVEYFDGGGAFIGSNEYEVHGTTTSGEFFSYFQADIKEVKDENGEHFIDFGNDLFPGHPYSEDNIIEFPLHRVRVPTDEGGDAA